ncbi:MAG: DUF4105 domain-containing protein [Proteobacteria bacterium]|nr:DUF4105 domain-containing protein [Pseudomonadota bacterium]
MLKKIARIIVALALFLFALWGVGALYFRAPLGQIGSYALIAAFTGIMLFALWSVFSARKRGAAAASVAGTALLLLGWYQTITPSDNLEWAPDVAHRSLVTIQGDDVFIRNFRNFKWRGAYEAEQIWEDQRFSLSDVRTTDLILSYWTGPAIAHMMISFGLADGRYYVFSTEIRRKAGQEYNPFAGFFRSYTLDTIVAAESDVVKVRTNFRDEDDYRYRLDIEPKTAQRLFVSMADLTQQLEEAPEFYNTVTANCSMTPFRMMSTLQPGIAPFDPRIITVGFMPSYLYEHKFIRTDKSLEATRAAARITEKAKAAQALDGVAFSAAIRAP